MALIEPSHHPSATPAAGWRRSAHAPGSAHSSADIRLPGLDRGEVPFQRREILLHYTETREGYAAAADRKVC